MSVKHLLFTLLCGALFISGCASGTRPDKTPALDELLQQERLYEENTQRGGKAPDVQVITDKATIDRLHKTVEAHIARKQKEKQKQQEAIKKNPAAAYKQGEQTSAFIFVVPGKMQEILKKYTL
nr:hypothetical protein [uncultured Chitinophaga sp.]